MSFHLFRSFSPMLCIFQSITFVLLLLNLFLSILFNAFVSGIVFLVSFLDCSLQVFGAFLTLTVEFKIKCLLTGLSLQEVESCIIRCSYENYNISALAFKKLVVRLWAVSDRFFRSLVLKSSKLMTTYATCMVSVTDFSKALSVIKQMTWQQKCLSFISFFCFVGGKSPS